MNAWIALRLVKFLGLVVLSGGTVGALLRPDRAGRLAAAYRLVVPGLLLTWTSGYLLMHSSARSFEVWILAGVALSLVSLHGVMMVAHREAPRPASALLAAAGLMGAVVVMVTRPVTWVEVGAPAALGLATGWLLALAVRPTAFVTDPGDGAAAWVGLRWLGRAEGASLILLMLIATPLKRGAGILLDGGTGALGWVHGALFLIYLQALLSVARSAGWPTRRLLLGVGAAVVPFGTLWFERTEPQEGR
jgi:integral membrane protein